MHAQNYSLYRHVLLFDSHFAISHLFESPLPPRTRQYSGFSLCNVCMYICVGQVWYACMYVCLYVFMYVCLHVYSRSMCMYIWLCGVCSPLKFRLYPSRFRFYFSRFRFYPSRFRFYPPRFRFYLMR